MTTPFLRADLRRDEGVRYKPYKDSLGIWTIGCGHNLQVDPVLFPTLAALLKTGITDGQVDDLLDHDIALAESALDQHLPWWRQLDDTRQDVLVNMTFNMGIGSLLGFTNTLHHIRAGDWSEAANHMLASKWAKQVGRRAARLAAQMATGAHEA